MTLQIDRIRGMFDRSPVALTLADMTRPDTPLVLANKRFSALTGYDPSAMLGRNCRFLQRPGENAVACSEVRQAMAAGRELQVIFHNYRENGEPFDNLLFLHPVDVADGKPRFYLGSQFVLARAPQEMLVGEVTAHATGLQEDLQRLSAMTENLHQERRRHLAEAAASLVSTWIRAR